MAEKLKGLIAKTRAAVEGTPFAGNLVEEATALLDHLALGPGGKKDHSQLNGPGARLTLGKATGAQGKATILLEKEDGSAAAQVEKLKGTLKDTVDVVTLGSPSSHRPQSDSEAPGALIETWRPGRSMGHVRGAAGTLGVFVTFEMRKDGHIVRVKGFTAAAHVLTLTTSAKKGDTILSPGYPDVERDPGEYGAGVLQRWCELVHHSADHETAINLTDIAYIEMREVAQFPTENAVPDPTVPDVKMIRLKGVASKADVDRLEQGVDVFMVGRTSGFRRGRLRVSAGPTAVNLLDRKTYIYGNLYVVAAYDDRQGFSEHGDSGAPVYSSDGILLGFIVGQAQGGSLMQLAKPCLDFARAELVT